MSEGFTGDSYPMIEFINGYTVVWQPLRGCVPLFTICFASVHSFLLRPAVICLVNTTYSTHGVQGSWGQETADHSTFPATILLLETWLQ